MLYISVECIGLKSFKCKEKLQEYPQLVCLSGLSAGLGTKGSLVRFPVRAHVWIVGLVPVGGV